MQSFSFLRGGVDKACGAAWGCGSLCLVLSVLDIHHHPQDLFLRLKKRENNVMKDRNGWERPLRLPKPAVAKYDFFGNSIVRDEYLERFV